MNRALRAGTVATSLGVLVSFLVSILLLGCVAFTENVPPADPDSDDSGSSPAPVISSIAPNEGSTDGGTVVAINGANFQSGARVNFGSAAAASVSFVSSTQLRATTRPSTAGTVTVEVINPDGKKDTHNGFTFKSPRPPAPSITSISPTSGSTAGGTVVTINGANFQSGARVFFGNVAATSVSFVSSSQLRATSPPHPAGSVPIQVTNPDGQSGQLNTFTYVEPQPLAPQISGITPTSGPTAGGTDITINGANFQSGATVTFDGTAAATNFINSSQLIARTPPHAAGAVTLEVRNPDGQSARTTFNYVETTSSIQCPQQNLACETFDAANFSTQWDWNLTPYVKNGVGVNGSRALEVEIPQDVPDTIFPRLFFPEQGINWVYARFQVRASSNYVFYPNNGAGAQKLAYLEANSATGGPNYWRVMLRLQQRDDQGDGLGYVSVDYNTHTDFISCPIAAQCRIERNRWYTIEFAVLPNQRKGVANGAIKVWINGVLVIDQEGLDFKKVAQNDQDGVGFQSFWVSAYYGGPTMPHPTMWLWYDNIAVARQYIGPIQ